MRIFLLLTALTFSVWLTAQTTRIVERSWHAFNKHLDAKPYRGMPFVLEGDLRVEQQEDSTGLVQMWARVDTKDGIGFFDNMDSRPVTTPQWKRVKIEGVIDSTAEEFYYGGLSILNGDFYFDNFRLRVKDGKKWKEIPLDDGDFEKGETVGTGPRESKVLVKIKGFDTEVITDSDPGLHGKVMHVRSRGIPVYGENKKRGRYFETNGAKIYYEVYGSGPPLLLLHGNGQSIDAMDNQIKYFDSLYTVIVPDCRGRGKSTDSKDSLSYAIQASDMNNLLNHLGMDSVDIIGWSDGGIIGIEMAMRYPAKLRRLIVSGANVQQDSSVYGAKGLENMIRLRDENDTAKFYWKLINLMIQYPSIPYKDLARIKCPSLIVAGDQDEILIGHTIKIFESIHGAELFIVPGTSHYVLSENPQVFNEAALKFFRKRKSE